MGQSKRGPHLKWCSPPQRSPIRRTVCSLASAEGMLAGLHTQLRNRFCRRLPMRAVRLILFSAVYTLVLPLTAAAAVQLPYLFSDHAVLQRDRPVRIWGWAYVGENVTV